MWICENGNITEADISPSDFGVQVNDRAIPLPLAVFPATTEPLTAGADAVTADARPQAHSLDLVQGGTADERVAWFRDAISPAGTCANPARGTRRGFGQTRRTLAAGPRRRRLSARAGRVLTRPLCAGRTSGSRPSATTAS